MKKIENSVCLRNFGNWIKGERERKGMTQTEIATMVGIDQTYYSKIELAHRKVDFVMALNICKALKLDLSDFIKTQI